VGGLHAGVSGADGSISSGAGGGFPSSPGLPYANRGPWTAGGPSAEQGMATGTAGHGGGTGVVAVLAALLLITLGVLRLRRSTPLGPRSAWVSALEVPG
jgi:hypothetical protein